MPTCISLTGILHAYAHVCIISYTYVVIRIQCYVFCRFEQKAVFAVVIPRIESLRDSLKCKGLEEVAALDASALFASKEAVDLVSYTCTFVYTYVLMYLCMYVYKNMIKD